MKLLVVLAIVRAVEGTISSSESSLSATENYSTRMSKGLYTNPKMVDNRNLFSPRMEYDEWTPLGRGDPLKNDPTYDYVPPVLERVHYWMDPSKRTPDPPVVNSGVLILGSSRTEPTFTMRATTSKYQGIPTKESQQADSRLDTMSLLDPFLKLMDVSKFGLNLNPSTNYYKPAPAPNRIHPVNYPRPAAVQQQYGGQRYQQPQALQRPPYTMLMPPPPPPSPTPSSVMTFATVTATTTTTTEPPKTQVFRSTTGAGQTTTAGTTAANPTAAKESAEGNGTTVYPTTIIANTENLYKPVAIAMPEENETIRVDAENDRESAEKVLPIVSVFNQERKTTAAPEKDYENTREVSVGFHAGKRPPGQQKRPQEEFPNTQKYKYRPLYETGQTSSLYDNNLKQPEAMSGPLQGTVRERYQSGSKRRPENRATTVRPAITTRMTNVLTTDPMFKHYKQPSEPIRGPFYLIIQGHSKVKTYGASKNPINGLVTSNEIREDGDERKDRRGELYELESEEQPRKRGKELRRYRGTDGRERAGEDERRRKFGGSRAKTPAISELSLFDAEDGGDGVENLEEAFGKSEGGTSKKRFLVNDMINDAVEEEEDGEAVRVHRNRQLLGEGEADAGEGSTTPTPQPTMITVASRPTRSSAEATHAEDNLDIESFIALNDDYSPEDVISLLLREEGQGSGLGNFVVSIFGKSLKEENRESS